MAELVRRKQLIRYLPDFMKQFGELQEIMKAEDLQFDHMDLNVQRVLNDAFIEDADEYGIRKYETLLGIVPGAGDTLESRKSKVLLYWNNKACNTHRTLINKLNMFCGVNNYDLFVNHEKYDAEVLIYAGNVNEVEMFLEKFLPATIRYKVLQAKKITASSRVAITWQDDVVIDILEVI